MFAPPAPTIITLASDAIPIFWFPRYTFAVATGVSFCVYVAARYRVGAEVGVRVGAKVGVRVGDLVVGRFEGARVGTSVVGVNVVGVHVVGGVGVVGDRDGVDVGAVDEKSSIHRIVSADRDASMMGATVVE